MRKGYSVMIYIRRKTLLRFLIAVGIFFITWRLWGNRLVRVTAPLSSMVSGRTVVIDAGHGGKDPGAIGKTGLKEKDITLDVALRLKRLFSRAGAYVVMIREKDLDYSGMGEVGYTTGKRRDLLYRVEKVNNSQADLLLSIHVNSFPQSIWSGAQCFYDNENPDSKILADLIQKSLVERLGPNKRRAKAADYLILKATKIPSVTAEIGFISNPREEELLSKEEYRERVAEALFAGTALYFREKSEQAPARPVGKELIGAVYPELPPAPPAAGYLRLYFAGPLNDDLELWPEEREIVFTGDETLNSKGRKIIREILQGPGENSALLPCIPPGDWIRSFYVQRSQAVVDLNNEICEAINGGSASELLALYGLVHTLAENLPIDEVKVLINGEPGSTLGGHLILDQPVKPKPEMVHRR